MGSSTARPLRVGGRVFRVVALRYKPRQRFDLQISSGRSPFRTWNVGLAGMADRNGYHAKDTTGGDGHIESPPPDDALGTALWLLGTGLWPVAISPPGDPNWPSPGKSPIG